MNFNILLISRRLQNRWRDLLAVLAGYCNDRPNKTNIPGEGGPWLHWRCALPRGHGGVHRSRNAVWDDEGKPLHLPVADYPHQPRGRHLVPTMRQERNVRRWHAQQSARRRAERLARGEPY